MSEIAQINLKAGWKLVVKIMKSLSSARVPDAVVDVSEKELGEWASVPFNVTDKKAGIAGAHGYTFNLDKVKGVNRDVGEDEFCQAEF